MTSSIQPYFLLKMDENSGNSYLAHSGSGGSGTSNYVLSYGTGSTSNTNTRSTSGRMQRSLKFNTNYVDITNKWNVITEAETNFTVCFWARKFPGLDPTNGVCVSIYGRSSSTIGTKNFYMGFTGESTFKFYTYLTRSTSQVYVFTTQALIENIDGNWHHYAVVRNDNSFWLYRDGVINGGGAGSGDSGYAARSAVFLDAQSSGNTYRTQCRVGNMYAIGDLLEGEKSGDQYYFNGCMDNFALYNTNLSATDLLSIYKEGRNIQRVSLLF